MRTRYFIAMYILLLPSLAFGQQDKFNLSSLTTKDGLSNNHVNAVLEDSKGFLWIATYDGLNRWNGYEFKSYRKETDNPNSLPGNFILTLAEDQNNNLWVGTNNDGLVRYSDTKEKFYRYGNVVGDDTSIPGNIIRCIKVDKHNNVWVGTNYGLAKYDQKLDQFKRYLFPKGMTYQGTIDVRRILQISDNELLIQNSLGLFVLDIQSDNIQKAGYNFPEFNESLFTQNEPLLLDSEHNLWVGSIGGLLKYNINTGAYKKYVNDDGNKTSISSISFSDIYEDSRNNIWIGTRNRGVNKYNKDTDDFTVIQEDAQRGNGLTNNIVTDIYEDRNSNLWFSTQEGGLNYFNYKYKQFEYFGHNILDKTSISSNKIGVIQEDARGHIWIGTKDGGINKLIPETKTFERFKLKTKFISPTILTLESKSEDLLYTSGWETGLYEFDTKTGKAKNLMEGVMINNKPLSTNIKGMKLDSKGNLWLASHEKSGIMVYSETQNRFYNAADPGPYDPVLLGIEYAVGMMEDSKNRLWVISYAGIYMFDGKLHEIKHDPLDNNTLSSNYTFDIYEDANKDIWVSNANGLDKVIEHSRGFYVQRYSEKYPLPTNIKGILEDEKGNLWLSSNQDIIKFSPESGKIKQYTISQELSNQGFYERSRLKSKSGEMYFGGINGFIRFHPDSLTNTDSYPKVYIVDFQLFNKSQKVNSENSTLDKNILETTEINLAHHQSVITFEFLGLNFNDYRQLEYAHKLEGFDDEWYYVGEKRFATYTNLPPGNYTFRVHLVENNIIQEAGTSLMINISPPFWKTNWAYAFYVVLIALIFYFFRKAILYREQLRNELKMEKLQIKNVTEANLMKLRFFTNVSHEFRTPLTLIKAPIEKLISTNGQMNTDEKHYHYNLIQANTSKLLNLVNQLMDYRKLEAGSLILESSNGDIVAFCQKVWSIFEVLAAKSNITYSFETEIESQIMSFDADKLDKIISNLLSNAFKNTNENGNICLQIKRQFSVSSDEEGKVHIIVKDDGVGIPKKDIKRIFERFYSVNRREKEVNKGTGIGLALSKELAELHKGEISVESQKGEGATFKLTLPFGKHKKLNPIPKLSPEPINTGQLENEIDSIISGIEISSKPRILILEDDPELQEFLKNELKSTYEVDVASDGEEGLQKAFLNPPQIIISDVTMPKMDGLEFCHRIKSEDITSHIPLILLTARHSQEKQLEGLSLGADDYILKPFNLEILKSRINNLLHSRHELANRFKNSAGLTFDNDQIENKDKTLIQNIIDIVIENLEEEKINADFIANRINMSRTLVYLKIEALTGQSVNEFIRNIRLKKSMQLLKESSLNITEIAYAVGFSSQSYFTRSFVKQFGVSPKKFLEVKK